LRAEFPTIPIHVHTHDTAGTGVASMLAAALSGANVVDVAIESLSGLTSQPAMGAIVSALQKSPLDTGIDLDHITRISDYWQDVRLLYSLFESGQKSAGADVYFHEMPGGQYTNLLFQSQCLGLTGQWPAIKKAYTTANQLLGDIIKVTPSSKVVGDLAQFMVQNKLTTSEQVLEQSDKLSFPSSVVEFMRGQIGQPYGGFPEELRSKVLKGKTVIEGRPGASLPLFDFAALKEKLIKKYGKDQISEVDLLSSVLYPKEFVEYKEFVDHYSDVSVLPTPLFLTPLPIGEEVALDLEKGKRLIVKLLAIGELSTKDGTREVFFEMNGLPRTIRVVDKLASKAVVTREKANVDVIGSVGAPMPGNVVELKVKVGQTVNKGDSLVVLSAMKMETVVQSPLSGVVKRLAIVSGDDLKAGDLLLEIE